MTSLLMKIKVPVWRSGKKNSRQKRRGKTRLKVEKGRREGARGVNGGGEGDCLSCKEFSLKVVLKKV